MTYDESLARDTDTLVEELTTKTGLDYSKGRDELLELVTSQMNGNWDNTAYFDDELGLRDVRVIQEDEYDQSMDEDEKPDWDDMILDASLGYVFPA